MKKTLELDREVVTTDYNGGDDADAITLMLNVIVRYITDKTSPGCFLASVVSLVSYTEVTMIATCFGTQCGPECASGHTCYESCYQSACVACYTDYNRVAGCSGGGYC
jgi:hypothetical protein